MTDVTDELAIRNVTAKLAHLADRGSLEDYMALYTEDAVWEIKGGTRINDRRVGRADILAGAQGRRANGSQGPNSGLSHVVTSQWVEVNGDTAESGAYGLVIKTGPAPVPIPLNVILYSDTYRRTPEGWKLARRLALSHC